jgi:hypothetical protein
LVTHNIAVERMQGNKVTGGLKFWATYDELPDDDSRRQAVQEAGWSLVEEGLDQPRASRNTYIMRGKEFSGGSLYLVDGSGFIQCIVVQDKETGESLIRMAYLQWEPYV